MNKAINNFLVALLVASFCFFPLFGGENAKAQGAYELQEGQEGATATLPTPQSPSGITSDTTPTFKWTKVSGATKYQFVLYKGSTQKYSKTVTSSACGSSTCSSTPTTTLAYANDYKWKVRAYISGEWKSYSSYKAFKITNIPTPQAPSGTTTDKTPTFKWTRITGATQYQFAVYAGTLKYSKIVPSSSCGSSTTTCSNTPTTVLSEGLYSWKVRAYVGGEWKSYSVSKSFDVTATTAFDSEFSYNANGWIPVKGEWSVVNGSYYNFGLSHTFSSSKYSYIYNKFTYEVELKRTGGANYYYLYGIIFNGTPAPLGSNGQWNKGYGLFITNHQSFEIHEFSGGVASQIVRGSYTDDSGDWDILKVTYNSSTKFAQCYINGRRVWKGILSDYTSGQVGVGIYRDEFPSNELYVNWAKLSLTAPASATTEDGITSSDSEAVDGHILDNTPILILAP